MVVTALIYLLEYKHVRTAFISLLILAATLTHYSNAVQAAQETHNRQDFWWQVNWRVPAIKTGTTLVADYPVGAIQEDYFVWGPANLIYQAQKQNRIPIEIQIPAAVLTDDTVLQIDTPESSVRAYEKGKFRVDVFDTGRTEITNFRGTIEAESREGRTEIERGRTLYITERGDAEFGPLPPADEWEKWNMDRDRQFAAWGESSRYLPDALHQYSYDLDHYGRWIYVSEYGYVWNPGVTAVDWVPYREGYWQWVRGRYVWISYEPWGWAPYHYGRWAYVNGTGWCWVPPAANELYWGPGNVGWVNTPEYVGWVPLAPGEIYYGYGYYGPRSVNIAKVNVNTIAAPHYRNVPVRNSVTVVRRDTFGTRERVLVRPAENPFAAHRDRFLPPASRPEPRPSVQQPIIRIPDVKRPPDRIQRTAPAEIKVQRKLERQPEASVFRPASPKPLPTRQVKEPKVVVRGTKGTERTGIERKGEIKRDQQQKRER